MKTNIRKLVVVIFYEDEHQEIINRMLTDLRDKLKSFKTLGYIKSTWANEYRSSEQERESETRQQAYEIAMMQICGDKRGNLKEEDLSDGTKKRLQEAKDRIFRAMIYSEIMVILNDLGCA